MKISKVTCNCGTNNVFEMGLTTQFLEMLLIIRVFIGYNGYNIIEVGW